MIVLVDGAVSLLVVYVPRRFVAWRILGPRLPGDD